MYNIINVCIKFIHYLLLIIFGIGLVFGTILFFTNMFMHFNLGNNLSYVFLMILYGNFFYYLTMEEQRYKNKLEKEFKKKHKTDNI